MGNCLGFSSGESSPSSIKPASSFLGSSWPNSFDRETSNSSAGNSRFSLAANESFEDRNPNGEILEMPNLKVFTFSELKSATKNFKPETVVGEGGFGKVYKGWIDSKNGSKIVVAIKKLNSESMQGLEEWQSELHFLGRLYHPNLVKLLGYCWEDNEYLLVYEHMPKGSLENHLFRRAVEPLAWDRRISIALGAARGLAFLHTLENQIIYRDFKASNILLDVSYNAKLSDFGLAKLGPSDGSSHVTTRVMGTFGYAAPEYVTTGHLYVKSDVYGFGVVLLEMLTGLRAVDLNRPTGQRNLVEWAKPRLSNKKKLKLIMDERIEGQYSLKAAFQAAKLILKCVVTNPRSRPSMKEVVEELEQIEAVKGKVNESRSRSGSSSGSRNPRSSAHPHSPYHQQGSRMESGSSLQSPKGGLAKPQLLKREERKSSLQFHDHRAIDVLIKKVPDG